MGLREDVIRELVTEYQQTPDVVTFSRILKRVDKLVLKTIHIHTKRRPHMLKIDLRDLYHSAIVGLGNAISTAKDNETGNKLIARFIAYIKASLNKDYPLNTKNQFFNFKFLDEITDTYDTRDREIHTVKEIELVAELSIMRDEYVNMLFYKHISDKDFMILVMRFGQSMTYKEIGEVIKTSEQNAGERAKKILKKVQEWFIGFE